MKGLLIGSLALFGLLSGGWMTFDALRRLLVGDYVRIDGQLGPWQYLFTGIGVDPMGLPVALLFLICGIARLAGVVGIGLRASWGWEATLLASIAALWYLPVGTLLSILSIALLFAPVVRLHFAG